MRSLVVLAALWAGLMAATPPASAQPATSAFGRRCDDQDELVRIAIASGIEGGMGNAAFNFRGMLADPRQGDRKDACARPSSMAGILLNTGSRNSLSGFHLYRERQGEGPHGYIDLDHTTWRAATTSLWRLRLPDRFSNYSGHQAGEKADPRNRAHLMNCFAQ